MKYVNFLDKIFLVKTAFIFSILILFFIQNTSAALVNPIINPGAELGTSGWTYVGDWDSMNKLVAMPHSGSYCFAVYNAEFTPGAYMYQTFTISQSSPFSFWACKDPYASYCLVRIYNGSLPSGTLVYTQTVGYNYPNWHNYSTTLAAGTYTIAILNLGYNEETEIPIFVDDFLVWTTPNPSTTMVAYAPPVYYYNGTAQTAHIVYSINNMSSSYDYFIWPMYYGDDGAWHIWENISVSANSGTKTTILPSAAIGKTLRVSLFSSEDGLTDLYTSYGSYVNATSTAELSGHVYNAETLEELEGVEIETYPNSIGSTHQTDTTDAQGVYNFSSIRAEVSTIVDVADDDLWDMDIYEFTPEADVHYILDLYVLPQNSSNVSTIGDNVLYGLLLDANSSSGVYTNITLSNSTWSSTVSSNTTSGYFIFNNVPAAGNYTFTASKTGYSSYTDAVLISGVTRYDAYIMPLYTITMRAQDAENSTYISSFTGTIGNTTLSTTTGNITFSNIEYGAYTLTAYASNYASSSQVYLADGSDTVTMSLYYNGTSTENATIQGIVYNAQTGYPIPYLPISLYQNGDTRYYTASSSGIFYFSDVLPDYETDINILSSNYTCDGTSITPAEGQNYVINLYAFPEDEEELGFTGENAIYGSVLDTNTNQPVSGASVTFYNASYSLSATTTSTGYYYFDEIPADGVYTLVVTGSGFTTSTESVTVSGVTNHNVYVTKTYTVNIKAQNAVTGTYLTSFTATLGSNSQTTSSGTATFSNIAYNVYTVTASATNYYTATQSLLIDGAEDIVLQLTPTDSGSYDASVEGVVYNALTGYVIGTTQVAMYQNGAYTYYTTSTSSYYSFPYLVSGAPTTLTVNDADWEHTAVTFTPVADTEYTINLYAVPADEEELEEELDISGDNSLYGIITDSQTHSAISGVTVTLSGYGSTTTSSTGLYVFDDITSAGTYTISASKSGYGSESLSVSVSGLTRYDISMGPAYNLRVKARDAETNDYVLNFTACMDDSCVTTTNGTVTYTNIVLGTYTISASATDYYAGAQTVYLSNSSNITIYLTPKSSQYYDAHYSRFILMSPLGSRHPNIPVYVYIGTDTSNTTVYTGTTGSDGSVTFKLLENVQYTINFIGSGTSESWVGYPKDTEYWIIVGASSGAATPEERASDQVLYGVSGNRINLASGRINASFVDNSGNSTLAELWINDLNGTNLYYFSTTANEYDWSQEVNATANATDYQVIFKITSTDFESGSMTVTKIISFINGVRIDFGFDEQWHYQLIGTLLIIAIASFFSLINIHIGAILTTFAGWFNLWAGWYPTETSTILMLMLATLVAFVFYMKRGESIS